MNKKFLSFVVVIMVGACLSACGGGGSSNPVEKAKVTVHNQGIQSS